MIAAGLTYTFNIYILFWCEIFGFSIHYSWNVDFVPYMADVNCSANKYIIIIRK